MANGDAFMLRAWARGGKSRTLGRASMHHAGLRTPYDVVAQSLQALGSYAVRCKAKRNAKYPMQ